MQQDAYANGFNAQYAQQSMHYLPPQYYPRQSPAAPPTAHPHAPIAPVTAPAPAIAPGPTTAPPSETPRAGTISTKTAVRALAVKSKRSKRLGMSRAEYKQHVCQVLTMNPSLLSSLGVRVSRSAANPVATSVVAAVNNSRIAAGSLLQLPEPHQAAMPSHPPPQHDPSRMHGHVMPCAPQRHPKQQVQDPVYDPQRYGDPGRFNHGMPPHAGFSRSAPHPHDYSQPPLQYAHQYSLPFQDGQTGSVGSHSFSNLNSAHDGDLDRALEMHLQQQQYPLESILD
jgi:hypothetical protein